MAWPELFGEAGGYLFVYALVGLAEVLPPLAVADYHVVHLELFQHFGGNLPRVCPFFGKMHVLGAYLYFGALYHPLYDGKVG